MDKCKHPEDQREPYHDMTVKCCACNCVIEQFGKPIDPPSPLSPKIWPVESSREPACYDALKQRIETLHDQLHNGIKYDEKLNAYVVCWTEKQIEKAKLEADELLSKIKWLPEAS